MIEEHLEDGAIPFNDEERQILYKNTTVFDKTHEEELEDKSKYDQLEEDSLFNLQKFNKNLENIVSSVFKGFRKDACKVVHANPVASEHMSIQKTG